MKLYHGSNIEIEAIDLKRSKRGKDFGKGFYTSADYNQAAEFTANVIRRDGKGVPTVTSFEFNESAISKLNVLKFEGYSKEWAEFVLANRQNKTDIPIHSYDIVIGPIADDSVGVQIRRLMRGYISIDTFLEEIKYCKMTIQYFFGSEEAIKYLTKI
ncbi:MAG: DUF3990 domain-containing protein [Bacteroidales bacterium]|nr:DUF3990 domain-containing protein [Candidatus Scybalocola fimicaballi]